MLKSIKMVSFKCFSDETIYFAPLTLLTGLNNSGKTSVLQAIRICKEQKIPEELGDTSDLCCPLEGDTPQLTAECVNGARAEYCFAQKVGRTHKNGGILENIHYIGADRRVTKIDPFCRQQAEHAKDSGAQAYAALVQNRDLGGVPHLLCCGTRQACSLWEQVDAWLDSIVPGAWADCPLCRLDADAAVFARFGQTRMGLGLSSVLPIIVNVLIWAAKIATAAKPYDVILLIENPEMFLHPRGQTMLGYFFALASQCGVQCIAETHSEHVLNGVCIAVKEGHVPDDDVVFHFFTKQADAKAAEVTSIFTDRHGTLDNWPEGFFDESERSLMRLL